MHDGTSGQAVVDRVGRQLNLRTPWPHIIGAALATASGALTSQNIKGELGFSETDLVTACVYLTTTIVIFRLVFTKYFRNRTGWLSHDRVPSQAEQRATLSVPLTFGVVSMIGWAGAAIVWTIITGHTHDAAYTARVALSILLGGFTACGLTFLLVEWTVRPVTARALADHVPDHAVAPGVRTKLVVSWAVGADVFLIMIGLTFIGRPANEPPSAAAIWFIVGAGLLAGTVVLTIATRSLVTPLRELRRAVSRVQGGDIDLQLAVNDGGELGLLQAGFNQMVDGLRERRTLHDLFGRHVGEEVARQALAQGTVALGGERREVGVIFVDVIGSTHLAQSRPPEDVVTVLNEFFSTVVRVVAAEGGWVNKFEGDGALCIFGAPMACDDYAVRALRAARTLRRELLVLAASVRELDAAIGVSAGTAVAGNVGAEQRYEYTVIGTPVNEAARLSEQAKLRLGRVLAGEEAVARSGDEARWWLVADELLLRGMDEPVLVYEPSGTLEAGRPAASRPGTGSP